MSPTSNPSSEIEETTTKEPNSHSVAVVCLIHAFTPKLGIWLSNGLGCFKLVLLLLVVFTGFAALAGKTVVPSPNNFSSFHGPGTATVGGPETSMAGEAAGYALALLQVGYSYSGWENANYVRITWVPFLAVIISDLPRPL